jgi:glutathione peroxidase
MFNNVLLPFIFFTANFYSNTITTLQGTNIDLGSNSGKKILLVNTATNSPYALQIGELEQLYQQHQDSLVIIAFPSNSFGNESRSNVQLLQFYTDSFNVTFPVSTLSSVTGTNKHAVYDWLSDSTKNGRGSIKLTKDFQKILIGENGKVVGIFNNIVSPLDRKIQDAINRTYY